MKKYKEITKMVILEQAQYVFNKLAGIIMYGLFIFIFLQLWKYMYTGKDYIEGYTLNQMVWYVAITELIWNITRPRSLRKETTRDIKSGKIAYILNKPYDFVNYLLAKNAGNVILSTLLYSTIGILITVVIAGPLATFKLESIPFIFITYINSAIVTALVYILLSMFAFWFEDNEPFFWIYEKFVLLVGVLFPIEIFPKVLQPIIKFSPIYSTNYAVAKMFCDFNFDKFIEILVFQVGYIILLYLLCKVVYRKAEKKLSVNGG